VQFLVPRQSYLHSLVPQALQQLQHLLPPGDATPWFEHGRLPLKWCVAPSHPPPEDFEGCMQRWCVAPQLPVTTLCNRSRCNACRRGLPAGVLYDLVAAPSGELPWRLTIHFRAFPDRMLPTYSGEAGLRAAFFNSLKEAACICRGSAQRVMEMAAGAQEDLWRHVMGSSLQPYRQILSSLQLAPVALRGRRPAVPLRLLIRRDDGGGDGAGSGWPCVCANWSEPAESLQ
jgi:autophagy-related protein 5